MDTQRLVIEVGHGSKRQTRIVEVPADGLLVAASIELRRLGESTHLAAGRYGKCIGVYFPPGSYTMTDVDPFTDKRGATTTGTIPERCTFWYDMVHRVADTMFDSETPQLYYYCKQATAPAPGTSQPASETTEEGAPQQLLLTVYERHPALREVCLRIHGSRCNICHISFEAVYGAIAAGFIHVHHLEPLGVVGKAHAINPAVDLIPVCPNCHAVIHMRTPPYTPEEVKAMLYPESVGP